MSDAVRVVEVGPRDGLQNEPGSIATATKLELIDRLAATGLREIEATAFVSPKWVPQMADHSRLMRRLPRRPGVRYPVLVPNLRGYDAAVSAGATEVAVFAAASEAFSRRNINCSIDESIDRFAPVFEAAARQGVRVRGHISCVVACPYEGAVAPQRVAQVASRLHEMGSCEITLGDTIGVATPLPLLRMLEAVAARVPIERLTGHYHDTWGMAAANVYASYEFGIRSFDASVAGLGGCPYAKGATGNVATEDLVYLFDGLGVSTGVELAALVEVAAWICARLGRAPASRVARAWLARGGAATVKPGGT
ncbi:MAG TPA: hydroxymethylglutaryl-CoA lyase [Burkholderiaceae bacterium]|nr:hydroxymethylglutaryl-CoA lyase [Burkholderiaceae bacterium]